MRSARSFYRINLGVGAVALLAILIGLAVSIRAVDFSGRTLAGVATACRNIFFPHLSVGDALVLILGSLSLAVLGLGLRSALRQLWFRRRLQRRLRVIGRAGQRPDAPLLIDDHRPQAFCAGYLRPRIYLSTGTLELLDDDELRAVLAHEEHHARRRDPLRVLLVAVISDALFFMPIMRRLRQRYAALAEVAADEAAVRALGQAAPLASAMLAFGQVDQPGAVGIGPERIDHLLGERPRWELPVSAAIGGVITIAGLFLFAASVAQTTGAGDVSLPLLTAQACMVVMILFPIFLGMGLLLLTKRIVGARQR